MLTLIVGCTAAAIAAMVYAYAWRVYATAIWLQRATSDIQQQFTCPGLFRAWLSERHVLLLGPLALALGIVGLVLAARYSWWAIPLPYVAFLVTGRLLALRLPVELEWYLRRVGERLGRLQRLLDERGPRDAAATAGEGYVVIGEIFGAYMGSGVRVPPVSAARVAPLGDMQYWLRSARARGESVPLHSV
jgi:hypothetical protein